MKRIISLLISLIMLVSCLSLNSCKDGVDSEVTSSSEESSTVETVEESKDVVIASGGEEIYSFIRYIDASKEEIDLIVDFKNVLNKKFDLSFAISADWTMPSMAPAADAPEIIVGLTSREATLGVIADVALGFGDCAVKVCANNKIVIVAPNYEDLKIGFDYFADNTSVVKNEDTGIDEVVYTGGDYLYEISSSHIWGDSAVAPEFKIVYDKAGKNKSLAESVAKAFNKAYDFKPEVICETEPKSGFEIIVGVLSDKSRFKYDYSKLNGLGYEIVTSDDSILLAASTEGSLKSAVDTFASRFIRTGNLVSLNLPVNIAYNYNSFGGGDSAALAEGADTRIMSFNILSEEWDAAAVMSGRDIRVSATILNYLPDVAALQEVSNAWYPILQEYIGDTYSFTRKKTPSGKGTYTTLIYNKETTKLIEEGIHIYSVGNSERLRSVVWGVFESIATNERYIVFSTHWDVGAERASNRMIQAKEMAKLATEFRAKYNADVFACGDYNASESTSEYKTFLSESGFVDAKTNAKTIKRACKTYHTLFSDVTTSTYESIDHITFLEETSSKVLFYNTLINDYIIDASDHCPIYIDIKTQK